MVRGSYRYKSHARAWPEQRLRIREIALTRVRYGYRKVRVLLNREGWNVGRDLVYRLYKEEGLGLKKRPPRRRKAARTREERFVATAPNQAWSLDFVSDQLQDGTRFRALTIVDVYTRESVAIEAGRSLKGADVVWVLNRAKQQRGLPRILFCDNGSEFTSQAMDLWAYQNGVRIDFSRPGKPTDNAFIESFNGTLRDECLNAHWFANLAEARQLIQAWRQEYNESRPHRSLGERTPNEFARDYAVQSAVRAMSTG
jgi:putative transposase